MQQKKPLFISLIQCSHKSTGVLGSNEFVFLRLYAIIQKKTLFISLIKCFDESTLCRWWQDIRVLPPIIRTF
jgi:hypothetical protein